MATDWKHAKQRSCNSYEGEGVGDNKVAVINKNNHRTREVGDTNELLWTAKWKQ